MIRNTIDISLWIDAQQNVHQCFSNAFSMQITVPSLRWHVAARCHTSLIGMKRLICEGAVLISLVNSVIALLWFLVNVLFWQNKIYILIKIKPVTFHQFSSSPALWTATTGLQDFRTGFLRMEYVFLLIPTVLNGPVSTVSTSELLEYGNELHF